MTRRHFSFDSSSKETVVNAMGERYSFEKLYLRSSFPLTHLRI